VLLYLVAAVAAAVIGLLSAGLIVVIVGAACLLPILLHVRRTGLRRAVTEPNPITLILIFYLLVFPLRGLVIAASGTTDLLLPRWPVSGRDLSDVLLLAAAGTTVLVEAYYLVVSRGQFQMRPQPTWATQPLGRGFFRFAVALACISIVGLAGMIASYGGVTAAQAALLTHTKSAFTAGLSGSAWQLFGIPAVWSSACIVINSTSRMAVRVGFASIAALLLAAMAVIYGSRLDIVLGLIGIWVAWHYAGRRVPVLAIVLLVPIAIGASALIVSTRATTPRAGISSVERYSRSAGYGVLDIALDVWEQPSHIHGELTSPQRWLDYPAYFVPSFLWPGRPDINLRRLDLYVAQAVGTANDQNTGFPVSYLMEAWLIGGWLGVVLISFAFGSLVGVGHRKLVGSGEDVSVLRLLAYAYLLMVAFTYYKDGDLVVTSVGAIRTALYLALLAVVTGAWRPNRGRRWPSQMTGSLAPTCR
jgi:hypothetical protein